MSPTPGAVRRFALSQIQVLLRSTGTAFERLTVNVISCGRLCLYRKKINLSTSLAGQAAGVKEVESGIGLVSLMEYDLGYIDLEEKLCSPLKTLSGRKCQPCLRNNLLPKCPDWTRFNW